MSRDVEVLHEMLWVTRRRLGGLLLEGSRQACEAESAALAAAIAALEAEETRNLHCPGCDGDHAL